MAEKRMFSKNIVLSDAFLDMPPSTRCLYFTLSMLADDDGFVNSPKSIMRQSGATDDDMKLLIAKFFLIPFETGIVVIRQWRVNNYLRSDRYQETKCLQEKAQLYLEKDGSYNLRKEVSAPKKIGLLEREPKNDIERVEKLYLQNYDTLYQRGNVQQPQPVINWTASRKLTKDVIEKYGVETVMQAVKNSIKNQFCVEKGYVLTTILSAGVLAGLINKGRITSNVANDEVNVGELDF